MGTYQSTRPAKNPHKSRGADGLRRHLTTRQHALIELVMNGHPSQPRFRDILPKTGMMWPFRSFVVGNSDAKIAAALRTVAPHLSESKLDTHFSRMFVEATKLAQQPKAAGGLDGPVSFLAALQRNQYVRPWAKTLRGYLFVMLFLIIRIARENWFLSDRLPADINAQPCKLAQAIDEFNKVDTIHWGNAYIMQHIDWLRARGGQILCMERASGEDHMMGDSPVPQAGQALASTVGIGIDNDIDMMADGVQELAIGKQ